MSLQTHKKVMYENKKQMGKEKQSKIIRNNSIVTEITDEERDSPGLSGIVIFLQTLSDEMKDSQELTGTNLL